MRARRCAIAVSIAIGTALVTGCAGPSSTSDAEPPAVPSPSVSAPAATATATPSPSPSAEHGLAPAAAVAAMNDFVDHDRGYDAWWSAFSKHLSPVAAQAFEYTDPAVIPATKVTDSGQIAAFPDGTSATVLVATDIGQYRVQLIRETREHPWFVERIDPPEES